jgi:hypothetical protein
MQHCQIPIEGVGEALGQVAQGICHALARSEDPIFAGYIQQAKPILANETSLLLESYNAIEKDNHSLHSLPGKTLSTIFTSARR